MTNKISAVYALTNTVTKRAYVGSTKDLSNRRSSHFWQLRNQRHKNHLIQADFDAYGADSFVFEPLEYAPHADLRAIEQAHIDSGDFAYNIAPKAAGGGKHTAVSAAKRSKTATGRRHTPEAIEKIRNRPREKTGSFIGYWITPTGRYASTHQAAEARSGKLCPTSIRRWCTKPGKTVGIRAFRKSAYLQAFGEGVIGRTYGDLGFGFEPVPKS